MKKLSSSLFNGIKTPKWFGLGKLVAVFAIVAFSFTFSNAQTVINQPASKDALLQERQQLVLAGASTLAVDVELLKHNVKFPAEVVVEEGVNSRTFNFTSVRGYTEQNAQIYANRITQQFAFVQSATIDHYTGFCKVVFSKTATETEINTVLGHFQFNGYTVK